MEMLALNETIDQLAKANSVYWYGHVLTRDENILEGIRFKSKRDKER